MTYLIGLVLAVVLIVFSVSQTGDNTGIYINLMSFVIVIGGTVIAGVISFSLTELIQIITTLKISFRKSSQKSLVEGVNEIIEIAKGGSSPGVLKGKVGTVKNLFLQDALQMIIDGVPKEKIGEILHMRIEEKIEGEKSRVNVIRTLSKYPTAFGMMGTIIGLVALLQGLGGGDQTKIGLNMAVALITTLYGIITAYFFLVPMADNLDNKTYQAVQVQKMILHGIDLILENETPVIVKETLVSYVTPGRRNKVTG